MANPIDEADARARRDDEDRRRTRMLFAQERRDVQELMQSAGGRRVVWGFLQTANADGSAYRENNQAMAHAVGWHDAAGYWLDLIRQHCPEREAQMRAEARTADKQELTDANE